MAYDTFLADLQAALAMSQPDVYIGRDADAPLRLALTLRPDDAPWLFCPITYVCYRQGLGLYDLEQVELAGYALGMLTSTIDTLTDASDCATTVHQQLRQELCALLHRT